MNSMLLFMQTKGDRYDARAEYNPSTKQTIVLKGSRVSVDIAYSRSFRGTNKIERLRSKYVVNNIVQENVEFKSSSTAASFVSGRSMTGYAVWKDATGKRLGEIISEL